MKIASQTEYISARINDYEAVRMVCEAGFDAVDFSMFHMLSLFCRRQLQDIFYIQSAFRWKADSYFHLQPRLYQRGRQ